MSAAAPAFDFAGARALVVGGGTGLGAAMAEALVAHGASVCIASRARHAGAAHDWIPLDIGDQHSVISAFDELSRRWDGMLHILVNCAGVNLRKRVEETTAEEWEKVLRSNLTGAFFIARQAVPLLRKAGWGRFVQVNSVLARTAMPLRASYAANKAGLLQFTRSLAVEWAAYGITANSISPGPFLTDVTRGIVSDEAAYRRMCERIPLGRFGSPAEIATACLFLCSKRSSYVTGVDIPVDGGWSAV
ncbi:MAG: SDR family oxidoreductase [Betaproteobacteria bacterium]|nr:MAG: SDR family oxidoreductase [Betaproteobacteria bacterium]